MQKLLNYDEELCRELLQKQVIATSFSLYAELFLLEQYDAYYISMPPNEWK